MASDAELPLVKIFWLSPDPEKADDYFFEVKNCKLPHIVWAAAELQKQMIANMVEADQENEA